MHFERLYASTHQRFNAAPGRNAPTLQRSIQPLLRFTHDLAHPAGKTLRRLPPIPPKSELLFNNS